MSAALGVLVFALLSRANAGEATFTQVVIVGPPANPLVRRLREESEALGFVVNAKTDDLGSLAAELDQPNVVAAMRVFEQPSEMLELVINDPERHQLVHEELPIRTTNDPTGAGLVATRAIELLRALRLRVPHAKEVVSLPPAPPPVEMRPAELPRPTTAVSLTPLLSYAPKLKLGVSAQLGASYVPRQIGLDAGVVVPLTAQRLEHSGGDVSATAAGIYGAGVVQTNVRAPLGARLGVGFEVNRVRFEGHAPPPLVNVGATALTYGPRVELTAAVRIGPHVRLLAPFGVSYVFPRTVIRFAGQTLEDWGPVLVRFGAGVEWYWP